MATDAGQRAVQAVVGRYAIRLNVGARAGDTLRAGAAILAARAFARRPAQPVDAHQAARAVARVVAGGLGGGLPVLTAQRQQRDEHAPLHRRLRTARSASHHQPPTGRPPLEQPRGAATRPRAVGRTSTTTGVGSSVR